MIAPCKDCPNKGCGAYHAQCEKYLEYVKFREYARENERKEKMFYKKEKKKWNKKN